MGNPREIELSEIRLDGDTQVRLALDQPTVDRYADLMIHDVKLPAVDVFYDGTHYWMAEGFHRYHAAEKNKETTILAQIHKGTQADAQYFALMANKHGLPLTTADRANAVKRALRLHPEFSDRKIADDLGVSPTTVGKYRIELQPGVQNGQSIRIGKDGRQTDTTNIGSKPEADQCGDEDKEAMPPAEDEAQAVTAEPQAKDPDDGQPAVVVGKDLEGHDLPERMAGDFKRIPDVLAMMKELAKIKATVLDATEKNDPLYGDLNVTAFQAEITCLHDRLSAIRPHSVCPYCTGDGCKACKRRGWVNKATWLMAPAENKAQME